MPMTHADQRHHSVLHTALLHSLTITAASSQSCSESCSTPMTSRQTIWHDGISTIYHYHYHHHNMQPDANGVPDHVIWWRCQHSHTLIIVWRDMLIARGIEEPHHMYIVQGDGGVVEVDISPRWTDKERLTAHQHVRRHLFPKPFSHQGGDGRGRVHCDTGDWFASLWAKMSTSLNVCRMCCLRTDIWIHPSPPLAKSPLPAVRCPFSRILDAIRHYVVHCWMHIKVSKRVASSLRTIRTTRPWRWLLTASSNAENSYRRSKRSPRGEPRMRTHEICTGRQWPWSDLYHCYYIVDWVWN